MQAKNIVIIVLVLVLIGAVGFLFMKSGDMQPGTAPVEETGGQVEAEAENEVKEAEETEPAEEVMEDTRGDESMIGSSVGGADITAYHIGDGEREILLVAGVHGGYSPNTTDLAEKLVEHFEDAGVPDGIMLTIIPELNPDGAKLSGAAGRFNANDVDLNRNFDCEWSETSMWQSREVSGGSAPFSEPEAVALRDYVLTYEPTAAIVWFSAEGKVYPSACADVPDRRSIELAATFATAAGYPSEAEFDAYAINGDMVNWMAKESIPAISVLLSDHQGTEWEKNLKGVEAILAKYAE